MSEFWLGDILEQGEVCTANENSLLACHLKFMAPFVSILLGSTRTGPRISNKHSPDPTTLMGELVSEYGLIRAERSEDRESQ